MTFTGVEKEVLIGFLTPLVIMMIIFALHLIVKYLRFLKPSNKTIESVSCRFYVGYYITLTFCYKNICTSVLTLINCKTENNTTFLFIDGDIECYTSLQGAILIFLIFWVIPFPFAVTKVYNLFRQRYISIKAFLMFLAFPVLGIFTSFRKTWTKLEPTNRELIYERLKESLEEPYRENLFWWETWRLLERLIIAALAVFAPYPLYRTLFMTPVFVVFTFLHYRINPYSKKNKTDSQCILQRLDIVSWICLSFHLFINGMRAVVYIYDVPNIDFIKNTLEACYILENLFSPLWYLIISYIATELYEKLHCKKCVKRFSMGKTNGPDDVESQLQIPILLEENEEQDDIELQLQYGNGDILTPTNNNGNCSNSVESKESQKKKKKRSSGTKVKRIDDLEPQELQRTRSLLNEENDEQIELKQHGENDTILTPLKANENGSNSKESQKKKKKRSSGTKVARTDDLEPQELQRTRSLFDEENDEQIELKQQGENDTILAPLKANENGSNSLESHENVEYSEYSVYWNSIDILGIDGNEDRSREQLPKEGAIIPLIELFEDINKP
uniref:Uncharacterized protein n=1 Tax=Clytia hemisphaerica TaxID=252671 RepID=A0A7M5TUS6_9CNID